MVITSLQEKQNRKFYVPIRPGNRGGWSLFQWQSVREMPYRDRQMYLGNSAVIGVLDKGGKWRKRDWYLKNSKNYNEKQYKSQQEQAMRRDQQRMNAHLGIKQMDDQQHLNEDQMRQVMKRLKLKKQGQDYKDAVGLGFDKTKVQIRAKPTINKDGISRLEGYNDLEQYERLKEKRDRQKHKKQKKHRVDYGSSQSRQRQKKKKHKHRDYSRSRSKDRKGKEDKYEKDWRKQDAYYRQIRIRRQRQQKQQRQQRYSRHERHERHQRHEKKYKRQRKHRRKYSDSQ